MKRKGENIMSNVYEVVKAAVVEAVGAEPEDITMDARLVEDLEAESLDIIDLLFKAGKQLGVKISMKELQESFRGEIPEERFINEQGSVSEEGKRQLDYLFGEEAVGAFEGEINSKDLLKLLDVKYIVALFEGKLGE